MTVAKGTLEAMRSAMAYIDTYGPEEPNTWSDEEKECSEAYEAYSAIKSAYEKEKKRVEKADFMARRRKHRKMVQDIRNSDKV